MLCAVLRTVAQTDCSNAVVVCGNSNFENLQLNGFGQQQEVSSCGSQEHNSLWLKIPIKTSGVLSFTIVPESQTLNEDFDFFLFSFVSCEDYTPIRCSTTYPPLAGLSSNVTGLSGSEADEFEGPAENGNGFVSWVDAIAGETYMLVIDRPSGNSNFSIQWTGTVTFNDPPQIVLPPGPDGFDLHQCDADGLPDGQTAFDLTQNSSPIIGVQSDIVVTYYTNYTDCFLGVNEIANPENYTNLANPQTIYVRAENQLTECFTTTEFTIGIDNQLVLSDNRYVACDDGLDGDASNGRTVFDLNVVASNIFADATTPGFTVKFYPTQQNALDGVNQLPVNFYNTTPNQQTVYISINSAFCNTIQPIDLVVASIPAVSSTTLVQCDFGPSPDGFTVFNLSEADESFTQSDPNLTVQYFESAAAMIADTPLPMVYSNTANPQSLVVKITDNVTGCTAVNTLTLTVNTVTAQSISPLFACDAGNGFAQFDLAAANIVTSAQESAEFYRTLSDALLQQNAISNIGNYTNPTAFSASVFVRIDDAVNGCSGISDIALQVNPLPVVGQDTQAIICANQPGAFVTIDAGTTALGLSYEWTLNQAVLPASQSSLNASQPGIYEVTAENGFGCTNTRTIEVVPSVIPQIESVYTSENTVTINVANVNAAYGYSIDLPDGPFQSSNYFPSVPCGMHTAYVDDGSGCGASAFAFELFWVPKFFTPNGDGFSDRWTVACGEIQPETTIRVYDRFGKLLKQLGAAGEGWDGTYNGQPMPSDDYWFVMLSRDGRLTKGHFSLKR